MPKKRTKKDKKISKKTIRRKRRKTTKKRSGVKKPSAKEKTKQVESKMGVSKKADKEEKIVYAKARYIRMSARKARLVIDLVRNENALEAISKLYFVTKRAALPVRKTIESAMANAENNFDMDPKKLVIKKAVVEEAPTYKRGRAGSRGRYKRILKRNCHIIIGLVEE
jgi:large subunit ribosomal protein L22